MLSLSLLLTLTACHDFVDAAQLHSTWETSGEIYGSHTVGQTFVAYHDGLKGVEVLLATYARQNTQPVVFHLRKSPDDDVDLVTVSISAEEIADNAFHRFSFPPIPDSHSKRYYFFLESPTSRPGDAITAWLGPADTYFEGALYLKGEAQDGQLIFRLVYEPSYIIMSLVRGFVLSLPTITCAILLFVLPGFSFLIWLLPGEERIGWTTILLLSPGVSIAIFPLTLLYARLAGGVRLGPIWLWGGMLSAGLLSALGIWRKGGRIRRIKPSLDMAALGILLIITFAVRFIPVRSLSVPMWGDSYQHTMIAQLIVDNGGLFSSWEPYVPLKSFTYHFGFHTTVAFFHWLTRTDIIRSVIVVGQALNALAVLTLYPLAVKLTKSSWAGVIAALVGGFLSPMPMYYVNWGRYTQLAGQVILPLIIIFTLEALEREGRNYKLLALATISLAGLALTHYRMVLFYLCFLFPVFVCQICQRKQNISETIFRIASIGLASLILVSPWVWNTLSGYLPRILKSFLTKWRPTKFLQEYNVIGDVSFFISYYLIALSALGSILGLINRKKGIFFTIAWVALLFLMANPYALRLPGTGVVNNFTVLIAIYIPTSILSGYLLGSLVEKAQIKWSKARYGAILLLFVIASISARNQISLISPFHKLVTKADEEAMTWIRENTPLEAKFLVNSFFAYGGSVIVGSDGGWWIPLLAGRKNTVPPLNYGSEMGWEPDYLVQVNELARRVQGADMDDPEVLELLRQKGITHIYIGQRQGRVNYNGEAVLRPDELKKSPHYEVVYHRDRVWIFALRKGEK
jgi:hypothetical protein